MRRYRRTLYARMGEFATLITGPSGTGKELVARAIAESRYVPFDDRRLAFADDGETLFLPINISALSPTLVESELFGHRRGSFTGAMADRAGSLETCPELGSVFLDELGDMDPAIQVKLLRVIETRTFHPVGDTAGRQFRGKLIAATNRDLAQAMRKGQFREDLYYRLCSDQISTPSLAEQIAVSPGVLRELVFYMARRVAGVEGDALAGEVLPWIAENLGTEYAWPGNYRELEQCVKNVLIRRNYRPRARGRGRCGGGVREPGARGAVDGGRVVGAVCDDRLQPHRKLRRDGAASGAGPADGEGEGGCGAAGEAAGCRRIRRAMTQVVRWRVFALAAVAIKSMALLMVRVAPRPSVEVGAALDVAMTVPALYFLLIVRGGVLPCPGIPYFGL